MSKSWITVGENYEEPVRSDALREAVSPCSFENADNIVANQKFPEIPEIYSNLSGCRKFIKECFSTLYVLIITI